MTSLGLLVALCAAVVLAGTAAVCAVRFFLRMRRYRTERNLLLCKVLIDDLPLAVRTERAGTPPEAPKEAAAAEPKKEPEGRQRSAGSRNKGGAGTGVKTGVRAPQGKRRPDGHTESA